MEGFVLVRRTDKKGQKLTYKCKGLNRITGITNSLVCEVPGLIDGKTKNIEQPYLKLKHHIGHSEAQLSKSKNC